MGLSEINSSVYVCESYCRTVMGSSLLLFLEIKFGGEALLAKHIRRN